MNNRGQATTEMMFLMPLLIMILGGAMFIVYSCWQGIKVQQAANFAARVQGQERVAGGTSPQNIDNENGIGPAKLGDDDPTDSSQDPNAKFTGHKRNVDNTSVYGKFYSLITKMFPGATTDLYIPAPLIGQNVDQVKVVRVINLPNIPFMKWLGGSQQLKLEGKAWGGEDTYMYALPRWGKAGSGSGNSGSLDPEYKALLRLSGTQSSSSQHD